MGSSSLRTKGKRTMDKKTTFTLSRRQFARCTGAAALVPMAAGLPALAPLREALQSGARTEAALPSPARPLLAQDDEPPGVDALLDYVRARYGDRLSPQDLEKIREGIVGNLRAGARIREIPLANSDEPGLIFGAYRNEAR